MTTRTHASPASDTKLNTLIERLVAALDPDKLVLFGSHARGDARPDSDVDLMVIAPTLEPRHRALARAYAALGRHDLAVDLVWYTPAEIDDWSEVPEFLATRALREGVVLYAKAPR